MSGSENPDSRQDEEATELPMGQRLSLLRGVKILDLTHFLAGPFGTMVLADMGASVLKVERKSGDSVRYNPPHFFGGDSAYFLSINRNKDSLAIDLGTPEGREVLRRLAATADVIVDNLRAPQREALGLAYHDLEKINPGIVSCSVTGFGSDGPYSDRPAYDIIVEAMAGVMSVTGPHGGPSVRAGVPIGDIVAGLYVAIAVLGGLEHRRRTGRGQHLDISMLDAQLSLFTYLAQFYFIGGVVPTHQGRAHLSIPTYNTFVTADGGEIVIAANTEDMWRGLCKVLNREDLTGLERFASNPARLAHRDELVPILQEEIGRWTTHDLYEALVDAGVPSSPINSLDQALREPQVAHREMVVTVPHRNGGTYRTIASAVKSDETDGAPYTSPPALGGNTRTVLADIGYSADDIEDLVARGVVRAEP